ncbi:pirin family protein [Aeromicrobium terrae]|jgi:redox-sensitive bicupin YhaK (pirin superfamily)|uniref:Pirin family protein n=1 Tax=Aeromicrobium terrae TaxID=2498846 RepID=A0A5C8NMM1_9ACTN|nr:pirin family protein [Aeromicrobium terrae]TXL62330.1 pirin family protein [Aeromicrobium terrae]
MPEIRRSADRYVTESPDVTTFHSFSYGAHYDPQNVGFGPLIAINEENVAPGAGYDAHRHADVEIVTWVLEGALDHEDTTGHRGTIRPGTAQRLSAGTGVEHAERNASATEPLRFVQMMLASEHLDEPDYDSVDVSPEPGVLTPAVSVSAPAELFVLHLDAGQSVTVPGAPRSLVHVTTGSISLDGETLEAGDEARLTDGAAYDLSASGPADALIWQVTR